MYWEFVLISFFYIFFACYTFVGAVFCTDKEAYLTRIKALDLISKRAHSSLFSEYDHVNPVFHLCSSHEHVA